MKVKEKLTVFKQQVLQEVNDNNNAIRMSSETAYDEAVERVRESAQAVAAERYRSACREAEQIKNREIVKVASDRKKELFALRTNKLETVFEAVDRRLTAFCAADEYRAYLLEQIEAEINKHQAVPGDCHAYLDERDMVHAKEITRQLGVRVLVSPEVLQGGFRLIVGGGRTLIDRSFQKRRAEVKKEFNPFSVF